MMAGNLEYTGVVYLPTLFLYTQIRGEILCFLIIMNIGLQTASRKTLKKVFKKI